MIQLDNNFRGILFVYGGSSLNNDAYSFRIDKFKEYFSKRNYNTKSIYLKDYLYGIPSLFQPLNMTRLLNTYSKCDIIHAGSTSCAYVARLSKFWNTNIKLLYDVHGDTIQEWLLYFDKFSIISYYNLFQSVIMEYFASQSDYFITCSEPLKQHYIKKGIDPDRIEVIRNGVDLDLFKPLETKFEDDKFVVTYAGGFQKWQGIENLIDAAKLLHNYDIKFKIIGFAKSDQRFKNKIATELGNSVDLIDVLPREELIAHLHSSDILIIPRNRHPAIEVALPTKFAEYIAMGKPVIVTGVDETADFVQKYDCGLVCEPNPTSIADAIITAKSMPSEELSQKGLNGRLLAEKEFDQKLINDKYYNFLHKILNDGN
jgi:glycosyltransferase involved in cell wall biosynthesis